MVYMMLLLHIRWENNHKKDKNKHKEGERRKERKKSIRFYYTILRKANLQTETFNKSTEK